MQWGRQEELLPRGSQALTALVLHPVRAVTCWPTVRWALATAKRSSNIPNMDPQDAQRAALIAASLKQKTPAAILDPTCVWNPDKDAAAQTALANAQQQNLSREVGGALFKNADGQYCYSIPVGGVQSDHIVFAIPKQNGITPAGIYHTHPLGGNEAKNDQFSPDDVDMANRLKMTSYIKALTNGVVKRYDPGVTPTEPISRFDHTQKSAGVLVPKSGN